MFQLMTSSSHFLKEMLICKNNLGQFAVIEEIWSVSVDQRAECQAVLEAAEQN